MTIERIVRPFQSRDVFRARVIPPQPDANPQDNAPANVVVTIKSRYGLFVGGKEKNVHRFAYPYMACY